MKKKVLLCILILLVIGLGVVITLYLTGVIGNSSINNCKNCKYARYSDGKEIGYKLDDYKTNYKELNNRIFLGHELDSDNRITKQFACGIVNNQAYCLEGTKEAYESNKKILDKVFTKCTESVAPVINSYNESEDIKRYSCYDDYFYTNVDNEGDIYIQESKSNDCTISDGKMYCYIASELNNR